MNKDCESLLNVHKRNSSIELLRIVAMFLIMQYHFVIHGGISVGLDNLGVNAFTAKMMCMGGKIGVNIFIIISSWFFVESSFTYEQVWARIKKVYIPVWTYSVLIYVAYVIRTQAVFNIYSFIKVLFPFSFSSNWYASAYIIFLFFIPALKIIVNNISKSEHRTICIVSLLCWSIIPTMQGTVIVTALNHASNIVWFSTCFLTVAYIKKYFVYEKKSLIVLGGVMCLACYAVFALSIYLADYRGIFLNLAKADYSTYLMQINYIPVIVCSFALFFAFYNTYFYSKSINKVARLIFGVYLIHDNDYINNLIWEKACRSNSIFLENHFYLKALFRIAIVFLCCCVIDAVREYVSSKIVMKCQANKRLL